MSLEVGGRSDKLGNHYENMYLAKLLIRLVEESLASIEVEPLGAEGKGVEYIAEKTVSRILHASRVYYPLIYGSIVSYLLTHGKSRLVLRLLHLKIF